MIITAICVGSFLVAFNSKVYEREEEKPARVKIDYLEGGKNMERQIAAEAFKDTCRQYHMLLEAGRPEVELQVRAAMAAEMCLVMEDMDLFQYWTDIADNHQSRSHEEIRLEIEALTK